MSRSRRCNGTSGRCLIDLLGFFSPFAGEEVFSFFFQFFFFFSFCTFVIASAVSDNVISESFHVNKS